MEYLGHFHPSIVVGVYGLFLMTTVAIVEHIRFCRHPLYARIRKSL